VKQVHLESHKVQLESYNGHYFLVAADQTHYTCMSSLDLSQNFLSHIES